MSPLKKYLVKRKLALNGQSRFRGFCGERQLHPGLRAPLIEGIPDLILWTYQGLLSTSILARRKACQVLKPNVTEMKCPKLGPALSPLTLDVYFDPPPLFRSANFNSNPFSCFFSFFCSYFFPVCKVSSGHPADLTKAIWYNQLSGHVGFFFCNIDGPGIRPSMSNQTNLKPFHESTYSSRERVPH